MCNVSNTLKEKRKKRKKRKKLSLKKAKAEAVKGGSMNFFLKLRLEVNDLLRMEEQMW